MQFDLGQDNNDKYAMNNKKQNYSRTTVILLFVRIR